jgi:hypothetical protein
VSQRQREVGIRIALGHRGERSSAGSSGTASVLAGIGVVTGATAAAGVIQMMRSLLFDVSRSIPWGMAPARFC